MKVLKRKRPLLFSCEEAALEVLLYVSDSKDLGTHCNANVGSILVTSVSTLINFVLPLVTLSLSTTWGYQDGTLHVSIQKVIHDSNTTRMVPRWNNIVGVDTHYYFLEAYKTQFLTINWEGTKMEHYSMSQLTQ